MGDAQTANALRAVVIGVVLIATFVFFFVYPGHDPEPNHLPVGLVIEAGESGVANVTVDGSRGGFDIRRYADAAAAREAILDREIYGAVVLSAQPRLLIARAASFQAAVAVEGFATRVAGSQLRIEDVRTLDVDDPRGTTLNLAALPLVIVAILAAMLIVQLAPMLDGSRRLGFIALFAVLGSAVAMFIVNVAIGALPGPYPGLVAISALAILATSSVSAGVIARVGPPGIMLCFLFFLMLGNPASGAASAPELLPDPWRVFGQFMPGGAGSSALRNVAYFDGAALAKPLAVLSAYVALGAILLVVLPRRRTP